MKERRRTIPPKLKPVSEAINNAIEEAKRIRELSVQEEVIVELGQGQRGPGTGQGTDHEDHAIVLEWRSDALYPRVNRWTGFTQIPRPPAA